MDGSRPWRTAPANPGWYSEDERTLSRGDGEEGLKRVDPEGLDLKDRVVHISRVAKVVKGGRRFSFSAVVVVGDANGHVGTGLGKANEVPDAIRKAVQNAKRSLIVVPLVDGTIPHGVTGEFGASKVIIRPGLSGDRRHRGRRSPRRDRVQRDLEHPDEVPGEQQSPQPREGDDRGAFPVADRGADPGGPGPERGRGDGMSGKLRITLLRGLSGRTAYHRKVVQGLGITRLNRPVVRLDTPEIRGMVEKVKFLVRMEEVGETS